MSVFYGPDARLNNSNHAQNREMLLLFLGDLCENAQSGERSEFCSLLTGKVMIFHKKANIIKLSLWPDLVPLRLDAACVLG